MPGVKRTLTSLVLLGALAAPVAISARPIPQEERHEERDRDRDRDHDRRFYDRGHRDYHAWGPHEDVAYRRWLAERHTKYVEFGRLSAERQRAYWAWRHEHPDVR